LSIYVAKDLRLERIYSDKEDVEKHTIEILSNYADYCKQLGNRKPSRGQIFNEQEYRQELNEMKSTQR